MRYTTIIDIRDIPPVWTSSSARQLYVYMCLACGFEDYNRDILTKSIRGLAYDAGLTVSATRHALGILTRSRLVKKTVAGYKVTKWFETPTISPRGDGRRRQTAEDKRQAEILRERDRKQRELFEQIERTRRNAITYQEYLNNKQGNGSTD